MESQKTIASYSLEYRGIGHDQYWNGVSTSFTGWDDVFTGIGDTPYSAAEDSIDMLAQVYNVSNLDVIKNTLAKRIDSRQLHMEDCARSKRYGTECDCESSLHCYAVLWVKYAESN